MYIYWTQRLIKPNDFLIPPTDAAPQCWTKLRTEQLDLNFIIHLLRNIRIHVIIAEVPATFRRKNDLRSIGRDFWDELSIRNQDTWLNLLKFKRRFGCSFTVHCIPLYSTLFSFCSLRELCVHLINATMMFMKQMHNYYGLFFLKRVRAHFAASLCKLATMRMYQRIK